MKIYLKNVLLFYCIMVEAPNPASTILLHKTILFHEQKWFQYDDRKFELGQHMHECYPNTCTSCGKNEIWQTEIWQTKQREVEKKLTKYYEKTGDLPN